MQKPHTRACYGVSNQKAGVMRGLHSPPQTHQPLEALEALGECPALGELHFRWGRTEILRSDVQTGQATGHRSPWNSVLQMGTTRRFDV